LRAYLRIFPPVAILLVGFLIFHKSLEYYAPDFSHGYLSNKKEFFNGLFKYGLYAHIISSPLALLIGTLQIFVRYEKRFSRMHAGLRRAYVFLVLGLAGPGGLVLGAHAIGGLWGRMSFYLLSMLWMIFTSIAYYLAIRKKFVLHQKFMNRSFILACSAVNLRWISFIAGYFFGWRDETSYVLSAWLSWLPFLLAYECILMVKNKKIRRRMPTAGVAV
jgi:hypothetical protein